MKKDILILFLAVAISVAANQFFISFTASARAPTMSRLQVSDATSPPALAEQNTQMQTVNVNSPVIMPDELPKVNVNTATVHELQTLPGIGETLAARIIESRPYSDPYELMDVEGFGYKTLQSIIDRLEV